MLNQITVAPDSALLWNGSRVTDAQVLSYAKIVAQLQPGPVTALVLRPGVTDERRGALISLLNDAGICTVNHPCTLVENWAAEVAINPPPPPPAPPAG
ncbi:hypothetical protein GCM10007925_11940 [Sphingomonas astaxanthinifaciens DSM 22298]|uniref:Uncharacterized protein n=1 Tax=Sphingomonas astaxanthinifaciens DSM 22298 TaxID=1123267 RepID=A0ABQ5ZA50_9SPHN|nr:hypothetical protein GCM10007925_11940 [Sphingomonas astaxanthinifaciens DSM 22298]